MENNVELKWQGNMAFTTEVNGHELRIDADPEVNGNNTGPRPKPLMLVALAGCTGMDVAFILKKMKVSLDDLKVAVKGVLSDDHPKQYISMHVTYTFIGKDLPMKKLERAVRLSEDNFCGASALYKKAIPVTSEIKVIPSN
jgi:putative redox protein